MNSPNPWAPPRISAPEASAVEFRRGHRPLRLYGWCVLWGVATDAVTGAVIGAAVGIRAVGVGLQFDLALAGAFYGLVFGVFISVVPSLVGALVVVETIRRRHPYPSSRPAVEHDLSIAFCSIVGILNTALLLAIFGAGRGLSSVGMSLPFIVLGNVCVGLMLARARRAIASRSSEP